MLKANNFKKIILVIVLISVITNILLVFGYTTNKYTDVNATNWFYNDVISCSYMLGYKDGIFNPNRSVTRAELATVVNRIVGQEREKAKAIISAVSSIGYVILDGEKYASETYKYASSVFVSSNTILTASHVIDCINDTENIRILTYDTIGNKTEHIGRVVKRDRYGDLALIELHKDSNITPITVAQEMGSTSLLDDIYAIGCPNGLFGTVTFGKIVKYSNSQVNNHSQFDVQVLGGSSGGAILNSNGELISIISSHMANSTITFGSNLNSIKEIIKD